MRLVLIAVITGMVLVIDFLADIVGPTRISETNRIGWGTTALAMLILFGWAVCRGWN